MNGLAGILKSGVAPGFSGLHQDPTNADVAIPRALKEVEQTKGAAQLVSEMGWKPTKKNINAIKKAWSM